MQATIQVFNSLQMYKNSYKLLTTTLINLIQQEYRAKAVKKPKFPFIRKELALYLTILGTRLQ